ncbi:hypothetical protein [Caudoviricetes sp.]|nr:hypothetical protein [Caudoviricetes sp.]
MLRFETHQRNRFSAVDRAPGAFVRDRLDLVTGQYLLDFRWHRSRRRALDCTYRICAFLACLHRCAKCRLSLWPSTPVGYADDGIPGYASHFSSDD